MLYAIAIICVVAAFNADGWESVGCLVVAGACAGAEAWIEHRYG